MVHEKIDLINSVTPIIKQAGSILLRNFNKQLVRTDKGYDQGFVTQADLESEEYLITALKPLIADASFYAEESGQHGVATDYCWVIDPLDGTTNFAFGLSYWCIAVALTYKNKPIFGIIYQPLLDELFYAQEGKGAYLNGRQLNKINQQFEQSLIAIGLPYAKNEQFSYILENIWVIARQAYGIRHMGAVAYDIANIAAGRLGGLVFMDLKWWDIAAGLILLQELGGYATDFQGKTLSMDYTSFIGTTDQNIHKKLLQIMNLQV